MQTHLLHDKVSDINQLEDKENALQPVAKD